MPIDRLKAIVDALVQASSACPLESLPISAQIQKGKWRSSSWGCIERHLGTSRVLNRGGAQLPGQPAAGPSWVTNARLLGTGEAVQLNEWLLAA